jgi:hypothetical protein
MSAGRRPPGCAQPNLRTWDDRQIRGCGSMFWNASLAWPAWQGLIRVRCWSLKWVHTARSRPADVGPSGVGQKSQHASQHLRLTVSQLVSSRRGHLPKTLYLQGNCAMLRLSGTRWHNDDPPTDQKVGGSNPSERTKVLTRGLPRVVADATEPTLCFRVSRETRESPCQGTHVGPVPI